MGSFDLFDAIVGVEFSPTQQSDGYEALHNEQTTLPTLRSPTPPSIAGLPFAQPGRSALKGTRLTPLTSRATFAEQTTILGDLEHPPIDESHRKHTVARFAHKRATFHRANRFYKSGTWTSPEGSDKHDTSFMSMSWPGYEKHLRESPTVDKNWVLVEVENSGPKPTFEPEVTKLINKARDRKVEGEKNEYGKDALVAMPATYLFKIELKTEQIDRTTRSTVIDIRENPPVTKQRVCETAIPIVDNKTDAEGPMSSKRQIDKTASKAQSPPPPPAVAEIKTKGKKTKKPNSSKMTTTERERIRMRENQKTTKDPHIPTGDEQKQLILYLTSRRREEEDASSTHTGLAIIVTP
jgi:hypothetical protein